MMNLNDRLLNTAEVIELLSSLEYRRGGLDEYLQKIAVGVSRILGIDWSVVTLSEEPGYDRILASSFDIGNAASEIYSLHGTVTERVMITGKLLCVKDINNDHEYGSMPEGYQAYMGVPLKTSEGKTIGTICSFNKYPRQFSDEEARVARVFAERAAAAIESYQTFRRLEAFNEQLEQEVQARTRELREAQEQLIQREKLAAIGEFASMIVHEERSPLSTISMALDYLRGIHLDERAAKRVNVAVGEASRLGSLLEEILLYANPNSSQSSSVNLNFLVEETVAALLDTSPQKFGNVKLLLADTVLNVHADARKLRQIVINLLTNACEASPEGKAVHLETAPAGNGDSACLSVRNATMGEPIDTTRITEPFFTTKSHGTGLGLAIVTGIVDALKGDFSINQENNGDVHSKVILPVAARQQERLCSQTAHHSCSH